MRAMEETVLAELKDVALLGCKAIRAALTYQGDNPKIMQQGKLGSIAVTNYVRARQTEGNREAVEAMRERQLAGIQRHALTA